MSTTSVTAPSVLAELEEILTDVIGDDLLLDGPLTMETSFDQDLQLESIEFVALADGLARLRADPRGHGRHVRGHRGDRRPDLIARDHLRRHHASQRPHRHAREPRMQTHLDLSRQGTGRAPAERAHSLQTIGTERAPQWRTEAGRIYCTAMGRMPAPRSPNPGVRRATPSPQHPSSKAITKSS